MMVGCSSTTFGISNAYSDIASGKASRVLVINPEITTAHNNLKNRDSHFIFGDVCTAAVIEKDAKSSNRFKILNANQLNFSHKSNEPNVRLDFINSLLEQLKIAPEQAE